MKKEVIDPLRDLLQELHDLLATLDNDQYTRSIPILSDASLGQHTRHIIEFVNELMKGYESGHVNYDQRKRDRAVEGDRVNAMNALALVLGQLEKKDRLLYLITNYSCNEVVPHKVLTSYERELIHNLEHVVHHMAIMRIGIEAVSYTCLPEAFGVAASTMRHRKEQVEIIPVSS